MYREEGVADYWVVDLDARAIECSTPADSRVDVAATSLKWHPAGATAPLVVDLERYFSEVLDS
jgi:hypothetical protein